MCGGASAAFVVGAVGAGQIVQATSFGGIIWMNGTLLALAAVATLRLPRNALDPPLVTARKRPRFVCGAWLLASYGAGGLGYEQPLAARWLRGVALEDGGIGPARQGYYGQRQFWQRLSFSSW